MDLKRFLKHGSIPLLLVTIFFLLRIIFLPYFGKQGQVNIYQTRIYLLQCWIGIAGIILTIAAIYQAYNISLNQGRMSLYMWELDDIRRRIDRTYKQLENKDDQRGEHFAVLFDLYKEGAWVRKKLRKLGGKDTIRKSLSGLNSDLYEARLKIEETKILIAENQDNITVRSDLEKALSKREEEKVLLEKEIHDNYEGEVL